MNVSIAKLFFPAPINHEELEWLIKEISTSKSVGLYSIPTNIVKLSYSVFSKPLVKLINFSFSGGTFPNLLKFANGIPVFKKGDKLDYNNYRPISIISKIGKLIEKIVHKRLSAANKYYSSASHHEQKNKKTAGQITFSAVTVKQQKKQSHDILFVTKCLIYWFKSCRCTVSSTVFPV